MEFQEIVDIAAEMATLWQRKQYVSREGSISALKPDTPGWIEIRPKRDRVVYREWRENIIAGLARARKHGTKSGKPIGRPPTPPEILAVIQGRLAIGEGLRSIARSIGVGLGTVHKIAAVLRQSATWRAKHRERTVAGLQKARAQGTRSGLPIGRPMLSADKIAAVRASLASGAGIRETARLVGVGIGTVHKLRAAA